MPLIAAYYRPNRLDEALALLAESNRIPLAGGTIVNADREHSETEVVDLQSLELDGVESTDGGRVRIGATTTLAEFATNDLVPSLLARLAVAELPSTLRTLATIGGTIATAEADSVLLAGLLVHDARVEINGAGDGPLAALLADGIDAGSIITAITIDPAGEGADAATGRTPADVPIVAAVGRSTGDGVTLALTGVATTPIVVDTSDPTAGLSPSSDFRGSADYRRALATILTGRVMDVLR